MSQLSIKTFNKFILGFSSFKLSHYFKILKLLLWVFFRKTIIFLGCINGKCLSRNEKRFTRSQQFKIVIIKWSQTRIIGKFGKFDHKKIPLRLVWLFCPATELQLIFQIAKKAAFECKHLPNNFPIKAATERKMCCKKISENKNFFI